MLQRPLLCQTIKKNLISPVMTPLKQNMVGHLFVLGCNKNNYCLIDFHIGVSLLTTTESVLQL